MYCINYQLIVTFFKKYLLKNGVSFLNIFSLGNSQLFYNLLQIIHYSLTKASKYFHWLYQHNNL